jgi:hypothetical protein
MIQVGQKQVNGVARIALMLARSWEILASPRTMHYAVVNKDDTWHEARDRILAGKERVCIFLKNLKRVRDADWPAVSPKCNTRCRTPAVAQEPDRSNMT